MSIGSIARIGWNYGKRVINVTPDLVFGLSGGGNATTQALSEAMLKGYRKGGMFNAAKTGWQTLEGAATKSNLGFWSKVKAGTINGSKATWEGFTNFAHNYKVGARAARMAGKSSILAGMWNGLKGFSKAVPYLGTALFVLFEIPNIYNAIKDQGLWQGAKETVKAGSRLCGAAGGAAAGAAIGSAICPGIGTAIGGLIGWFAGEALAGKITGKSYSEKKAEQQNQLAQVQQEMIEQQAQIAQAYQNAATANPYSYGLNPQAPTVFQSMPMNNQLNLKYANDFMFQKTFAG